MLIWDGFSSMRRATQECRESFELAQQSCRRKDARSSGVNFPDSALDHLDSHGHTVTPSQTESGNSACSLSVLQGMQKGD